MTAKQERAMLSELGRIYENCPERVATYRRRWRIGTGFCWILIVVAIVTGMSKASGLVAAGIAFLSGLSGGFALLFAASVNQMPLLVRYSTLRKDDFEKRMQELKDG